MRVLGKVLLRLILAVVVIAALGVAFLTVTEYRPADVESVEVSAGAGTRIEPDQELTILSWNVGYGGLGAASDFFMDGGTNTRSADRATVERYLAGMASAIGRLDPDLVILQEVDQDSARSWGVDQR